MWETAVVRLGSLLTPERFSRIASVAAARINSLACVVEGLYDTGNISAIQRSCDAFGIHHFHTIRRFSEDRMKQHRRISKGSEKWLSLRHWTSSHECIAYLKQQGYDIAVTANGPTSVDIADIDLQRPTAFVFGNELSGLSSEILSTANFAVKVPQFGMVDSLNVSVAAGCVLHTASQKHRAQEQRIAQKDPEAIAKRTFELLLRAFGNPLANTIDTMEYPPDLDEIISDIRKFRLAS
eukprot:gene9928-2111_t